MKNYRYQNEINYDTQKTRNQIMKRELNKIPLTKQLFIHFKSIFRRLMYYNCKKKENKIIQQRKNKHFVRVITRISLRHTRR